MAARTDSAILHEIVRIIQERAQVPEKVRIRTKQYVITYLEDHRQRLEEAMRRRDVDRLGMLFGQLPGRIKYQMLKASRKSAATGAKRGSKPTPRPAAKPRAKASPKPTKAKSAARVTGKRRARA